MSRVVTRYTHRLSSSALCSSISPRPPGFTLFPYTTLFRSWVTRHRSSSGRERRARESVGGAREVARDVLGARACTANRSEEHTSELQSPCNLVCRLLLEKKKKNT